MLIVCSLHRPFRQQGSRRIVKGRLKEKLLSLGLLLGLQGFSLALRSAITTDYIKCEDGPLST